MAANIQEKNFFIDIVFDSQSRFVSRTKGSILFITNAPSVAFSEVVYTVTQQVGSWPNSLWHLLFSWLFFIIGNWFFVMFMFCFWQWDY
jgi:hypothetical protein